MVNEAEETNMQQQEDTSKRSVRPKSRRNISISDSSEEHLSNQLNPTQAASPSEDHTDAYVYELSSQMASTESDAEKDGYDLFADFVEQQDSTIGAIIPRQPNTFSTDHQEMGRLLRQIADDFQDTHGRRQVKSMAAALDVTSISYEAFWNLCDAIFDGPRGVTPERIISLFFFFIDAARTQMVVLRQGVDMVYKVAVSIVCISAAVALSTYALKSWRT